MLKKILPFTGLIAAVLGIVAFILIMATPVGKYTDGSGNTLTVSGIAGIFGETKTIAGSLATHINGGWTGLLGWILTLAGIVALLAAAVLQWVLKKFPQIGSILAIVAGVALIAAGIFFFTGLSACNHANGVTIGSATTYPYDSYNLGGGWVVAGILGLCAGGVALINCILGIIASLKK